MRRRGRFDEPCFFASWLTQGSVEGKNRHTYKRAGQKSNRQTQLCRNSQRQEAYLRWLHNWPSSLRAACQDAEMPSKGRQKRAPPPQLNRCIRCLKARMPCAPPHPPYTGSDIIPRETAQLAQKFWYYLCQTGVEESHKRPRLCRTHNRQQRTGAEIKSTISGC